MEERPQTLLCADSKPDPGDWNEGVLVSAQRTGHKAFPIKTTAEIGAMSFCFSGTRFAARARVLG